ncbi:MAG TPA: PepSY-associated TM helix domain-containing protein, partial [Chitinophaga sp.]
MVKNIKKWLLWHRWTSLICTIFLLLLCITGLPLIFREEVLALLNPQAPYPEMPANTPLVNLDKLVTAAYQRYPHDVISFMYLDEDAPQVVVNMLPAYGAPPKFSHSLHFDARTGALREDEPPEFRQPPTLANVIFSLHTDLFLDLPGELFLCGMGILFVISIITGLVLYGPYMKKLPFGTVRRDRSRRFRWLDLHNLLGIATGAWLLVVGATGVMNELSTPLFGIWRQT